MEPPPPSRTLFVTGKLAEFALREVLEPLAKKVGFEPQIEVLNITVAALMTTEWVAKRLAGKSFPGVSQVVLPGYCRGELEPIERVVGAPAVRGPKDLRELPLWFGAGDGGREGYGAWDVQIIAEINHAPRMSLSELLAEAARLRTSGADVIDVGCNPGETWSGVGEAVKALVESGCRVSIDTFDVNEIAAATKAGAELVLSVNQTNRAAAPDWGVEVVAVPDDPHTLAGLDDTVEFLADRGVRLRIDPILEPIGFGFAASLGRYLEVRSRRPDAEMMMGIGNLTELTDVDSAGINVLLMGFCQEQGIRSVLTTQVVNWAADSVRECDLARRLVHYAVTRKTLPKRLEPKLVQLRDPRLYRHGPAQLAELAKRIKDENYRIFADDGLIHVLNGKIQLAGEDPFELFEAMQAAASSEISPGHAFYLGYEMAKAATALTLRKNYRQDQALDWGGLTRPEVSHREKKKSRPADEPRNEAPEGSSEKAKPPETPSSDSTSAEPPPL